MSPKNICEDVFGGARVGLRLASVIFLFYIFWPSVVTAVPVVSDFRLNGETVDASLNPGRNDTVEISLTTDTPVKFNTIAICTAADSVCSRSTAVKYFSQTDSFTTGSVKSWDGKKSSGEVVTDGNYKVKVTLAVEGVSGTSVVTLDSPRIIIDSNFTGGNGGVDDGDDEDYEDSEESDSGNESYSSHQSTTPIKSLVNTKKSEFTAGRVRLVLVNSVLTLEIPEASKFASANLTWAFGDGTKARGRKVEHIYRQAGDYVVVVTAGRGSDEEISRTTVKVLPADFSIDCSTPTNFTIGNSSKYEMNLGGWSIRQGEERLILAPDTILLPGMKLSFDNLSLPFALTDHSYVELVSPNGAVTHSCGEKPLSPEDKDRLAKIQVIEKETLNLRSGVQPVTEVFVTALPIQDRAVISSTSSSSTEEVYVLEVPKSNFKIKFFEFPLRVKQAIINLIN